MADFSPRLPPNAQRAPYASGTPGVRQSLEAMALKMREGRLDPGVRGWAIQALKDAGIDGRSGQTVRAQASAILNAFRAATAYAPDPYGAEYIPSAAATLCLRPNLCVNGEDCDGLSVALGSLMLSIGIPVQIVKQTFGGGAQEHVLIAIYDGADWLLADPSTNLPLGSSVGAASTDFFDPMGAIGNIPEVQPEIVTLGKPKGLGSVLGYPTTNDAHQLLDVAIYNAGQLTTAMNACTAGFPDADAWGIWKTDCNAMVADLNTITNNWNASQGNDAADTTTTPHWAQNWDYNPEMWDAVRGIIDRQIDLDARWRKSGTTCAAPTYSNEPQPVSANDPDVWVYKSADSAIKGIESVARNVKSPLTIAAGGIVLGVLGAVAAFWFVDRMVPARRR